MNERDVRGDVREIERLFDGGVAAAHHGDGLLTIEEAVAGGAGRDAAPAVLLFALETEIHGRGARGDDEDVGLVGDAHFAREFKGTLREVDLDDVVVLDARLEAFGLFLQAGHQVGPLNAFVGGGPVIDFGRGHELSARFHAGDDERAQIGAGGVNGRGPTGGTGAENDDGVVQTFGRHAFSPGERGVRR